MSSNDERRGMRGYGDSASVATVAASIARLRELARGGDRTTLLIEAGALAQGVIDRGVPMAVHDLALRVVRCAARGETGELLPLLAELERVAPAGELQLKDPEGFVYYAVYPELFAMAAQRLPRVARRTVVGIRSIGTTLGAVVAEASDATDFITVRPTGHPFQRQLELDEELRARLLARADDWVIVDEGPGLSGSSFGCVADLLEDHGIARERIVFLPSHDQPPGAYASERHRARWAAATRIVVPFDELLPHIVDAAAQLIGHAPDGDPIDAGGGLWRRLVDGAADVPSSITREPRKYVISAGGRRYLLKFAGLGRYGEAKLDNARWLAAQGLTPPVIGLANGFLVTEFVDGRIVDLQRDRAALLEAVAQYLIAVAERHGDSDNRMHPWEWIVTPGGRILKCDAVDHAHGHDGVGPQDLAWDVVGAEVELQLMDEELHGLRDRLAPRRTWSDHELDSCRREYKAAQWSWFAQVAKELDSSPWPDEAKRLRARLPLYEAE